MLRRHFQHIPRRHFSGNFMPRGCCCDCECECGGSLWPGTDPNEWPGDCEGLMYSYALTNFVTWLTYYTSDDCSGSPLEHRTEVYEQQEPAELTAQATACRWSGSVLMKKIGGDTFNSTFTLELSRPPSGEFCGWELLHNVSQGLEPNARRAVEGGIPENPMSPPPGSYAFTGCDLFNPSPNPDDIESIQWAESAVIA